MRNNFLENEIAELRAEVERLRGLIIFEINGFCAGNWFSREHSYDWRGRCKYCGVVK